MIKELIEKRYNDYIEATKDILLKYQDNLIRAIRFFTKTDRDIQITSVYLYPTNANFVVNSCKVIVDVGDIIRTPDGSSVTVTEENKNSLVTNDLQVILPTKILETGNALKMYETICFIDDFVREHGNDKFKTLMESGISSFDDLMDSKFEDVLEEITNPINTVLKNLDELQLVQYNIFLEEQKTKLH